MYKTSSTKVLSCQIRINTRNSFFFFFFLKDSSLTILTQRLAYIPHPDDFDSILDPKPELNPLPLVVEFDPVPQPRLAELVP